MKQILNNKQIDFWLQITAIVGPIVGALVMMNLAIVAFMYVSLGTVQLLSYILNRAFLTKKLRHHSRTSYEVVLLVLTVLCTLALTNTEMGEGIYLLLLLILMFVTPFLTLWYLTITAREIDLVKEVLRRVQQDRIAEIPPEEIVFE